jgi:hypothetical protein
VVEYLEVERFLDHIGRETAMYDPLALDRQRLELERLRRLAAKPTTRFPRPPHRHR